MGLVQTEDDKWVAARRVMPPYVAAYWRTQIPNAVSSRQAHTTFTAAFRLFGDL